MKLNNTSAYYKAVHILVSIYKNEEVTHDTGIFINMQVQEIAHLWRSGILHVISNQLHLLYVLFLSIVHVLTMDGIVERRFINLKNLFTEMFNFK